MTTRSARVGSHRLRIGIGSMIETVLACAVCFAIVRHDLALLGSSLPSVTLGMRLRVISGSACLGLAVCGGVGLAIETLRGRRPSSWGIGRWIWSVCGLYAFLSIAIALMRYAAFEYRHKSIGPSLEMLGNAIHWGVAIWTGHFPWALTALCLTATFTESIRDPGPDLREWMGRLFASVIVASAIAFNVLLALDR